MLAHNPRFKAHALLQQNIYLILMIHFRQRFSTQKTLTIDSSLV